MKENQSDAKMPPKLNAIQRLFSFTGMESGRGGVFFSVIAGFYLGAILDRSSTESMVIFRDRSALYGGKKKEGEQPSWPSTEGVWL